MQLKPLQDGRTLVQHELTVDPIVDPPPAFREPLHMCQVAQTYNSLTTMLMAILLWPDGARRPPGLKLWALLRHSMGVSDSRPLTSNGTAPGHAAGP